MLLGDIVRLNAQKAPGRTALLAENAALRQRVGELERLVGQLKQRLWLTG